MRAAHEVERVRAAEAALMATLPEGTLMRRAAAGLANTCVRLLGRVYGARVVLLVGSGDNGGDTLYAGGLLARRGARVDALLLAPERAHSGGLAAARRAGVRVRDARDPARTELIDLLGRADLVLEGIVGIGGRGALRPPAPELLAHVRDAIVVAVDLPSGVDADTGRVEGAAVRADVTVTFGTYKPGLLVDPGAAHAGVRHLVDIGLDPHLPDPRLTVLQHADVARLLPAPSAESDKYSRGVLGVVAGSPRYPGAAVLVVGAAVRGGVGAVRCAGPTDVLGPVLAAWPETLATTSAPADAGRVQAWVVGPGLDTDPDGEARWTSVLHARVPVLVDADGLTLLARTKPGTWSAPVLLTPHAGEAVRLFAAAGIETTRERIEAERLEHARRLAALYDCVVLLKGTTTVIAAPDGRARINPTGTPWLATAGSGDVLSGLAGALLAAGLEALDAGSVAAYLHGLAARALPGPVTAPDLIRALPTVWADVTGT
ncbi:bifunctional ADP-dependent NAD(P)H-hydrate dehydratase/NAD(P)H-hydrate epimerase [Embleya scabrispora]|uniref:bifunctional ADP-dependent NAD(P)H-hydrate dehydratase/NAD(P)H-hydrate epimerase n=1 Tax=Embleya scabrispora TaxID=159449 RepID=UPI0003807CD7|nr:bifunctional ADP-dependent NAD(P)H-hydrate dehydratase/NAD(P)H-hydrate epimerase [Embleya scabrispora]MYS84385.1 bifunctional ADP-dependent NAD(P)H-hydrate dehydratase/NAD(P)H-hydrate epimerase [Streptomyces sp. SID5474]